MQEFSINKILVGFMLLAMVSCGNSRNEVPANKRSQEEMLVKINKYLVDNDAEKIRAYIKRRNWDMKTTQTGLWYKISRKGTGEIVRSGKIATLKFKISLLDGTPCYSSDSLGPKRFMVGKGGVERGLEEGILMLREGGKAVFIMPPHLAYGLTGDDDKIPPRSIIVYDVELTKLSDN